MTSSISKPEGRTTRIYPSAAIKRGAEKLINNVASSPAEPDPYNTASVSRLAVPLEINVAGEVKPTYAKFRLLSITLIPILLEIEIGPELPLLTGF